MARPTATGAPSWPDPPAITRNWLSRRWVTMPADSSGGGIQAGEAARTTPVPEAMRPVPNRLPMVIAQVTALPSRSITAKLVLAGKGGRVPEGATAPLRMASGKTPPRRYTAAAPRARDFASANAPGLAARVW